ncbi:MAG: phage baseplate assembly protein V [Pseudomonadota bacterium]
MSGENDDLLYRLAEAQRDRHFGKYRGLVRDVADPDKRGRIKATVPAVYGEQDSPWALPALPFAGAGHGLALLPEVGDGVWIEFEGGDISHPIWTGCWWSEGQRPTPDGEKARLLCTSAGHQVLIDEDANEMKLIHPGGAEIVMDGDGITLKMGSCELKISSTEINLNNGMVKVTTAGASLVNDAFKVGG